LANDIFGCVHKLLLVTAVSPKILGLYNKDHLLTYLLILTLINHQSLTLNANLFRHCS